MAVRNTFQGVEPHAVPRAAILLVVVNVNQNSSFGILKSGITTVQRITHTSCGISFSYFVEQLCQFRVT